jgi:conjugative relaxase-like TrwC/TraI family protein
MLTINVSTSAAQAVKYRTQDQARENYYSNGQELPGRWGGRGAARLGLSGVSRDRDFELMCYNTNPATGEQLTLRTNANRRVGYDFTFSAPKSVSLLYEWTQDPKIPQAFDRAITRAMEAIEDHAATRVRKNGRDENRLTKEMVYCIYDHFTARPVDVAPDPQMHRHCYIFNATFDPVEQEWKAGQFGDIKANGEYFQSIWLSEFSKALVEVGYEIVPVGKSFEIAGIARSLIEKFSKRTAVILKRAEELGITDPKELAQLGAKTRKRKNHEMSQRELHENWWAQLTPEDKRQLDAAGRHRQQELAMQQEGIAFTQTRGGKSAAAVTEPSREDLRAVKFAVEHLFERQSVVFEKELITEALQWGYGKATLAGVTLAVKEWTLIRGQRQEQTVMTTKEVLNEENRIVERCKNGKNTLPSLNANWEIQDQRLGAQQRDAVFHIIRSHDFITGVVGKSGTGKTTALQEAARAIVAGRNDVMAFAPTAGASRGNLRQAGFEEAETVAKLLVSESLQNKARGAVWFVDEGGLMSARVTDEFLALAEKLYARVVIIGDAGQHHAVERGDAFRLLQEMGEMSVVTVDEIQRQKGDYKRAVEQIGERKFGRAFGTLEKMGVLHEMPYEAREAALAKRYVELFEKTKSILVISPTHNECERVTQAIRRELKERGELGESNKWRILRNLSWTSAQKRDGRSYERGLVVQVNKHVKGFSLGERLEVVKVGEKEVMVQGFNSEAKALPLEEPEAFNVFKKDALEICEGERIRITANGRTEDRHRLNNGDDHTVKTFSPDGKIVLENGWQLARDFEHLDYGYTSTSHSSQGKTVDYVLVAQSALNSAGASDANQFYVSVSRGRLGVEIYTDSIEELRENVARVRDRMHALEIMEPEKARDERSSRALGEETEVEYIDLSGFVPRIQERLAAQAIAAEKLNDHPQRLAAELGQHGKEERAAEIAVAAVPELEME